MEPFPPPDGWFLRLLDRFRTLLVGLLFAVAVVGLFWLHVELPAVWLLPLWGLLVVVVGLLFRRRWQWLFGPVLMYDAVRTARRGFAIGHRCLYAAVLALVVFLVYWSWFPSGDLERLLWGGSLSIRDKARFAESFFATFMGVQLAVIVLVTPAYTAGVVAEEKQRRTLEFLLTTDLTNREIVLGLLGGRLGNMLLLVLTGLPVLSLLQFLGGVDPNLVLAGFLVSVLLLLTVGSACMLVSVHAKTPLRGVVGGYLYTLGCLGLATVPCFQIGNPFIFLLFISAGEWVYWWLIPFCVIHLLIVRSCLRRAIGQLRTAALAPPGVPLDAFERMLKSEIIRRVPPPAARQTSPGWGPFPAEEPGTAPGRRREPLDFRPARECRSVGEHALSWRELHAPVGLTTGEIRPLFLFFLGLACFCFVLVALTAWAAEENPGEYINAWVKGLTIPLYFVTFLVAALSAANRLSREREQQTLESLLTLPVEREAILFAKWLGSIASVRLPALGLAALWVFGAATGGLSFVALPLLVAAWVVHVTFAAALGLWFSTHNRTTLRSTLFTLLTALLAFLGPGFLVRTATGDAWSTPTSYPLDAIALVSDYGLTPLTTLWTLCFRSADLLKDPDALTYLRIAAAVAGLYLYLGVTAALWLSMRARFRADKGPRPRRVQATTV